MNKLVVAARFGLSDQIGRLVERFEATRAEAARDRMFVDRVEPQIGRTKAEFLGRACADFREHSPSYFNMCIAYVASAMDAGCIKGLDSVPEIRSFYERERRDGRIDFPCD